MSNETHVTDDSPAHDDCPTCGPPVLPLTDAERADLREKGRILRVLDDRLDQARGEVDRLRGELDRLRERDDQWRRDVHLLRGSLRSVATQSLRDASTEAEAMGQPDVANWLSARANAIERGNL